MWAYVIYYQARITHENNRWKFINQVRGIEYKLEGNPRIKIKDVLIEDGGYRENNSVEFWIVPENAELPAPTPTFDKAETFICPNIFIYNETPAGNTETINFIVPAYTLKGIENYSLTWRVSAGEIVEGQGLDYIKVKLNDSAVKRVTAYLEVNGLPYLCPKVFLATAEVERKLYQVDSFGLLSNGDIKNRMDNFMNELQKNPTAKGYIIIYGSRGEGNRDAERRLMVINNYSRFRNFDMSRINIVRGGFRETVSADFWLSFDESQKPIPTPTVDEKFVAVPKAAIKLRPRKK